MVKEVEKLHAELHLDALRDFEVLVDTHVHIPRRRAGTNSDSRVSNGSQLEAVDGEHIGIEIGLGISTTCTARLPGNTIGPLAASRGTIPDT